MKVIVKNDEFIITFPRSSRLLAQVRSLPVRRYDGASSTWRAPYVIENWEALRVMGVPMDEVPRPLVGAYRIETYKKNLAVYTPGTREDIDACRAIPDTHKWSPDRGAWLCAPTPPNINYILARWPTASWSLAALEHRDAVTNRPDPSHLIEAKYATEVPKINDYKFSSKRHPDSGDIVKPMEHQVRVFALSRDREAFALFMEQGTGKSRVLIDTVSYRHCKGELTGALVIAPNSMKYPWLDEIELMTPSYVNARAVVYSAGMSKEEKARLEEWLTVEDKTCVTWLIMNVEAFSSDKGRKIAERFLARYTCAMAVDESTAIKNPSAKRTKAILKLGKMAPVRRILTGTPVTQGPLDLYAPFKFLDPYILGFGSFYSFRNHFALMGGFNGKQIQEYVNLDELQTLIDPHSFRVLRVDCLDLPPKQYMRVDVELSKEQRRIYKELKNEMVTTLSDNVVTVTMVLTQLLRLQQVVGGFLPVESAIEDDDGTVLQRFKPEPIPGPNPKIDAMLDIVDNISSKEKVIVWARFRAELELIRRAFTERYGDETVVSLHGGIAEKDRRDNVRAFQSPTSPVRFFIGQTETGGRGITLTAASFVIYYSNSFSLESRLQSEDRAHRIGQRNSVEYIDLVAKGTIDVKLRRKLRGKKETANIITGDAWTEWL